MAFCELHFYSDILGHATAVNVILPERSVSLIGMQTEADDTKPVKTLYLLHGLSDDHTIWCRRSSIERYAAERGIAVVMPNGGRSWYTDQNYGEKMFTYLTKELPAKCHSIFRQLSTSPKDTLIAGISMGGYGALKAALRCPGQYGAVASLSGAFSVADPKFRAILDTPKAWEGIFGDCGAIEGSDEDVYALAKRDSARKLPVYLWCGEQDFLLESTKKMEAILRDCGYPMQAVYTPGSHAWTYWDTAIAPAIDFLLKSTSN